MIEPPARPSRCRSPGVNGNTVLVAGGSGFIGSPCILNLLAAGHRGGR